MLHFPQTMLFFPPVGKVGEKNPGGTWYFSTEAAVAFSQVYTTRLDFSISCLALSLSFEPLSEVFGEDYMSGLIIPLVSVFAKGFVFSWYPAFGLLAIFKHVN